MHEGGKMKNCLCKFLVVISSLILVVTAASSVKAKDEIKIGALYPLTGSMALLGNHDMNGVELATDIINERGGIKGKKVLLIKGDASTPEAARSEAERLINVENLNVIFGTYSSSLSYVASSVAEKHKRIYWETGAIADNITQRNFKYLFRSCEKASDSGNAAVDFILDKLAGDLKIPIKDLRICIMHEDSLYGTSVMAAATKRLKERNVKILANESYTKTVTDLSPLVMRFKALKPDVVLATCYINDAILWNRQMRELNLYVKAMVGTGGGHSISDFAKALGRDSDGVFSSDPAFIKNPKVLDPQLDPPLKTVFERYKKKYGEEIDIHAILSFTGAWVFYKYALTKAATTDPEILRKTILQIDVPTGGTYMGFGVKFQGEKRSGTRAKYQVFFSYESVAEWRLLYRLASTLRRTQGNSCPLASLAG